MTFPSNDERFEDASLRLRGKLGILDEVQPDLKEVLRKAKALGIIKDYAIVPDADLPDDEARFDPALGLVMVRQSTMTALGWKEPRSRFAIAHEFGHYTFGHKVTRNRSAAHKVIEWRSPSEKKDEWEANNFAAAFLCPYHLSNFTPGMTVEVLMRRFGVSRMVAELRLPVLERMYRRKHGQPRPLPPGVIDFLLSARKEGHQASSLIEHERYYGLAKQPTYEGEPCPNPKCGAFKMTRAGTSLKCEVCGTYTGEN